MTTQTLTRHLTQSFSDQSIQVSGFIASIRHSKRVSFIDLTDGTTTRPLQVVLPRDCCDTPSPLVFGVAVTFTGTMVASPGVGQDRELLARSVLVHGSLAPDYPIQHKEMTDDFLRGLPSLRIRTPKYQALARVRSSLKSSLEDFLRSEDFAWTPSPVLTDSDAEGGGECFEVKDSEAFFGKRHFLTVSGQLELEAMAMGVSRAYTFGPAFRAEKSDTSRHLSEFFMLETEMAFFDMQDTIDLAERMIKHSLSSVFSKHPDELSVLLDEEREKTLRDMTEKPFRQITYKEACGALKQSGLTFQYPTGYGHDLKAEHERALVGMFGAVFVTHYPRELKSFYMKKAEGDTVEAFDLLVPGPLELIGGSARETDVDVLIERMTEKGMDQEHYKTYIDLRKFGSAPHAGFGLGFERLLLLFTGGSARDVAIWPRHYLGK